MAAAIRQDFPKGEHAERSWFTQLDHKLELLELFDAMDVATEEDDVLHHLPNVGKGLLSPETEQGIVEEAAWEIAILRSEIERMAQQIRHLVEGQP